MDDAVGTGERVSKDVSVENRALHEPDVDPGQVLLAASGKVVQCGNFSVTAKASGESAAEVCAYEPCATGDQNSRHYRSVQSEKMSTNADTNDHC
jgi:hypothetical protein